MMASSDDGLVFQSLIPFLTHKIRQCSMDQPSERSSSVMIFSGDNEACLFFGAVAWISALSVLALLIVFL